MQEIIESEEDFLEEDDERVYEHFRFKADPGQQAMRIDLFVMDRIERATRSKVQNAIHEGFIKVNDNAIKPNHRIKAGDEVIVYWSKPKKAKELVPQDIPLDVRYEDDDCLVIFKPAGLVCHPAVGHFEGTLANALAYRYRHMPVLAEGHDDRPGLVHRIDKNTTGLLLIAKTEHAMSHLARQFFVHSVFRRYTALVWGDVKNDEGTIQNYIGRDANYRKLRAVVEDPAQGKHATTHYKVLRRFGYVTLVECRLETGRTHQIRVHMQHIGHPLFNDPEYGGDKIRSGTVFSKYKAFVQNCFDIMPYQALHARALGFEHPSSGEWMMFESDLPDNFNQLLDKWENYTSGRL